jgi:hypothetical protein
VSSSNSLRFTCCFSFVVLFLIVGSHAVFSQGKKHYLERTLSISFEQESIEAALKKISAQAGFTFSYNPSILEKDKVVSFNFVNKTVREILDQIFKGTIQYKERNKYVILTKSGISSTSKEVKVVSGYVIDEATGQRLKNVSVYDPTTLSSAVTDAYGFFQIEIDKPTGEEIKLAVNKRNYTDTLVVVPGNNGRLLNIPLHINTDKISTFADSVGSKLKRFWLSAKKRREQRTNMENIDEDLYRRTQVSLVPFIGTNGTLSGNVINDYSFNILGGFSRGVRKFELGGLFNTVRGNVEGFQLAGLMNGVMGTQNGLQIAGLINANRDSSNGALFAGLINFNLRGSNGFSMAGLLNFTHLDSRGGHLAGLFNATIGSQEGPHLAGLYNFVTKDARPAQVAGLFNFTGRDMKGAQVAGLFNFTAKHMRGAQVSGLLNVASGRMEGAQVSGLINYATRIEGAQVGLINISDTIHGVPFGLLSIVGRGYHKIEVSADEIFYTNIAFRTGVRQFYNILAAGIKPSSNEDIDWTFGYGVGTAPRLSKKLFLNFDLTANQVVRNGSINGVNVINKLYIGFDWQFARKMSLTAGATLNGYVTDATKTYPELFTDYKPHVFYERTYHDDVNLKMWWGAKVGLRFL